MAHEDAPPADRPDRAALAEALQGTDMGSDTRAGSLRGGSASGSDIDPDQAEINRRLSDMGSALPKDGPRPAGSAGQAAEGEADGQAGDDVDAQTG